MGSAAYEYHSDDGNTYQIILDDTFAAALSYVPATGFEPYLPSFISPRYANYQQVGIGTSVGVLATLPFNVLAPPVGISNGIANYVRKSLVGERSSNVLSINAFLPPVIVGQTGADGAAGPPGPPGPGQSWSVNVATADLYTLNITNVEIVPAPGAGFAILPLGFFYIFDCPSTAFNNGGNFHVINQAAEFDYQPFSYWVGGQKNYSRDIHIFNNFSGNWDNQALVLYADNAQSAGDGNLTVTTFYAVVSTS